MTFKNKSLPLYATVVALTFLFACNTKKGTIQTDKLTNDNPILTIDTFSTSPPEIEGCSCYFSNDSLEFKDGKYIYMNDYKQTSFLKINGILTKFTQVDLRGIDSTHTIARYKSSIYTITIEIEDGNQNGDETWLQTGTIELTDQNGKIITKRFYGECGC